MSAKMQPFSYKSDTLHHNSYIHHFTHTSTQSHNPGCTAKNGGVYVTSEALKPRWQVRESKGIEGEWWGIHSSQLTSSSWKQVSLLFELERTHIVTTNLLFLLLLWHKKWVNLKSCIYAHLSFSFMLTEMRGWYMVYTCLYPHWRILWSQSGHMAPFTVLVAWPPNVAQKVWIGNE